ncbi:MAG: ATP-binding protein [candidate division WOR-3 bacterium]
MKKIFYKLFLSYFLILSFFSLLILISILGVVRNRYIDELKSNLDDLIFSLSDRTEYLLINNDIKSLRIFIKEFSNKRGLKISIYDKYGELFLDSDIEEEIKIMENKKPEIDIAFHGEKGFSIRKSEIYKDNMIFLAVPLYENDNIIGVLRIGLKAQRIDDFITNLYRRIGLVILILILFSSIISLILSRNFTLPLRDLTRAFKRISSGDTDIRIFSERKDELGELTKNFNLMAVNIKKSLDEIEKEKSIIDSLSKALPDLVLLLDKRGEVLYFNEKAKENFQSIEKGKFYYEFIKEPEFLYKFEKALEKGEAEGEISLDHKIFYLKIKKIPETENFVIVLTDITEMKKLEEVKRDFTLNLSHELKTPLTLIKGYIETIEEEEEIKNKRYISIIKRHIERLIDMTEKIISLSKIESEEKALQIEKINLREIIDGVLPIFEKRLKEKEIEVKVYIPSDLPLIEGDRFKLEQVFINLFDNSIKFTFKGEINIKARKKDNRVLIEFNDTGEGIDERHLPRIFERFYVGVRGREREKSGAGLGLAIVKQIINLHNGKISVESKKGEGTKFLIELPLKF